MIEEKDPFGAVDAITGFDAKIVTNVERLGLGKQAEDEKVLVGGFSHILRPLAAAG